MQALEFHPACLTLPKMDDAEYQALRASIRCGYDGRHPILLFEGMILDGRHRYIACQEEGVTAQFMEWVGGDPYDFVRKEHEARRSWRSQEQKALVIGSLLDQSESFQAARQRIQAVANARRKEAMQGLPHVGKGETRRPDNVEPQSEATHSKPKRDSSQDKDAKTSTAKAKTIGVSRAAVERAATIQRNSPELAAQVAQGEISAADALRTIKKEAVVANLEAVAARETVAPTGLYDVIVLDPPWPMQKIERDVRPNQVEFDYPTMSEAELAELQIPADTHCHVWLWTTHKFMPMAFRLLHAWGLKYVCAFVWHKPGGFQPIGLPQYNCEFALYARKGSPQFIDTKALPTCFHASRGAHSEKPEEFYDMVRRTTGGRRLDMFNRRDIAGFAGWGKEAA